MCATLLKSVSGELCKGEFAYTNGREVSATYVKGKYEVCCIISSTTYFLDGSVRHEVVHMLKNEY